MTSLPSAQHLIPLTQWAAARNIPQKTANGAARRGSLRTAEKIGRDWLVAADDEITDRRVTSGQYVGKPRKR